MDVTETIYQNERLQNRTYSKDWHIVSEESLRDLKYVDISHRRYCKVKRVLDVVFSLVGLALMVVPFGIIALMIYLDDPGNVLFSQERVGLHGKKFTLYKFRTMKTETPKYVSTMDLKDPKRYITRIGYFLRKYSLDEIPQLINVLKGDMSLVGPRPLIWNEQQMHIYRMRYGVYTVRPGITGLAQINGRDYVKPADKIRWDVKYLENFGLLQDLWIFFSTIPKVCECTDVVENDVQKSSGE